MIHKVKEKIRQRDIRDYIWKNFFFYMVIILILIWLMQNVFLRVFYSKSQIRQIEKIGNNLTDRYIENKKVKGLLENQFVDDSLSLQIIDPDLNTVYPLDWKMNSHRLCPISPHIQDFIQKKNRRLGEFRVIELENCNKDLNIIYVSYLGTNEGPEDHIYLLILSTVRSLDSTSNIMRFQFPIISGLVLALGLLISYIMARRISRPIRRLTQAAEDLAQGKYDVVFPDSEISEIRKLSDTLNQAKQKLREGERMRNSILANVTHDLRTPLTVIKSHGEMIKDIVGEDREARNASLDVIISEADRMTEMVNSIMEISKLEIGVELPKIEEISLGRISRENISRFSILEENRDYKFEIRGNSEGIIMADPDLMGKLVQNLISNAINFVGPDKLIIIEIQEDQEEVRYSVLDHGPGIKRENLEKIWSKYYTDHKNHSRHTRGTGLGLHIVSVILKRHGFSYGVESEKNRGTRFYFIYKKPKNKNHETAKF